MLNKDTQILLHIGSPKTGSTSLQSFCTRNREKLKESGILYPDTGRTNVAHHQLAWAVNPLGPYIKYDEIYESLHKEIESNNCNKVLLSSEVFFISTDMELLAKLLSGFDVKIFCYLRRQDLWYQSMYMQYIKESRYRLTTGPFGSPVMKIIEEHLDYYKQMQLWEKFFGKGAVAVRPYDRRVIGNDVTSDFFKLHGVDISDGYDVTENAGEKNVSLSCDLLELVRVSNHINYDEEERNYWLYSLQEIVLERIRKGQHEPCNPLDEKEMDRLRKGYFDSNNKLVEYRAYLDGESVAQLFFSECKSYKSKGKPETMADLQINDLAEILITNWRYYNNKISQYENFSNVSD